MSSSENERDTQSTTGEVTGAARLRTHLTLIVGLVFCAFAFWFELRRAEGGNSLSWAYVFEWPLLGVFAVYMWWKVLHPTTADSARKVARSRPEDAPEFESMRRAWEEHQRELESLREDSGSDPGEDRA